MSNYKLFNQSISFPDSAERYFDMMHRTWNAMSSASADFNAWYKQCGDIYTVLQGYEGIASELVIEYAKKPLFDELTSYEIYDISEESYDERCLDFSESSDAFDTVSSMYRKIVAQQAAEEEYREERKNSRGRFEGGGFGLDGALAGATQAAMLNVASGLAHTAFNAVGNAVSAAEASSSQKALYNNEETCGLLCEGIMNDIMSCFDEHIHLLNERLTSYIISAFDLDKANAFFESAKKVADKQQELLIDSFRNCPWNEDLLEFIFIQYKAEQKNVWEIAKRFHVDLSETVESAFAASYTEKARTSEKEAQAVKKEILAQMNELGITSSETINAIEIDGLNRVLSSYETTPDTERTSIFADFDSYDATQENKSQVVHDKGVWELAKKYSVEFTQEEADDILSRYYTDAAKKTEAEALIARSQIRAIMKTLDISNSSTLDLLENDCLERVCKNYQNANEAKCNKIIERIQSFEALEKNKKPFLNKIQVRIEQIWSKEDGEIFDNVYLNTNIHNQEEVKKAIEFVNGKGRTASSRMYISALESCTEENIAKAKKFQSSTTKFFMYAGFAIIGIGIILLLAGKGFLLSAVVAAVGAVLLFYYYNLKEIYDTLTIYGKIKHPMLFTTVPLKTDEPVKNESDSEENQE